MVNVLTQARTDVADALNAADVAAVVYVPGNLYTPIAIVGSGAEYVGTPVGNSYGKRHSINLSVLLLAADTAISEYTLEVVDEMIVNAVVALEDDFDVTDVSAPFDWTTEDGSTYTAALLNITINTNIEKGVI